ncbi:MAG TPA: mechanosensitive ion channel family protein [Verrucomicrobiae bacterium]
MEKPKGEEIKGQVESLQNLEDAAVAAQSADPKEIEAKATQPELRARTVSAWWFIPYVVGALVVGLALLALDWQTWLRDSLADKVRRYLFGAGGLIVVLTVAKAIDVYLIQRLRNPVSRFNLKRIVRLVTALVVVFIVISVLFVNWYAAVVSLGLISLILGFALQTPISSFIAWIYILARAPYRVGDRIEIGDVRGDVIDVSYLDTTLWEVGGRHLSGDHPSGRVIKFPNTNVFSTPVINYSWPLFPYIWNEIKFNIAYESDIEFVAATMQSIAEKEVGESMMDKVVLFRNLLAKTPVDHLNVKERPTVTFRVSDNTWLEATVRYLVDPKEAGQVKTRLTKKLLLELNKNPDRVLFPKSNMR